MGNVKRIYARKNHIMDDIYNLLEGSRIELVNGHPSRMPPPNRKHSEITGALFRTIWEYFQKKRTMQTLHRPICVILKYR